MSDHRARDTISWTISGIRRRTSWPRPCCSLFPEAKLAIGPVHRRRLLLRLPAAPQPDAGRPGAHRARDEPHHQGAAIRSCAASSAATRRCRCSSDQPFKVELISELPEGEIISTYTQDTFTDLCRGGHVANTGEIPANAFKLMNIAGRLLARRREAAHAAAHLWHGVADQGRAGGVPEASWKRSSGATTASSGSELDLFSTHEEGGAGPGLLAPEGRASSARPSRTSGGGSTASAATTSSTRRTSPRSTSGRSAGTGASTARTCTRRWTSTASSTCSSR